MEHSLWSQGNIWQYEVVACIFQGKPQDYVSSPTLFQMPESSIRVWSMLLLPL